MTDQVGPRETRPDPSSVGAQRPAPRALVRFAGRLGLLKHGHSLRFQMRPCGWCLVYGGATQYVSYPGMNPRVWLAELVPRRRDFEREERRAGRVLPPRLRVIRPKRLPCGTMRGPSRQVRRVRAVRSTRRTRAGPTRPDDPDPEPPHARRLTAHRGLAA
jgi:hypothetical protein